MASTDITQASKDVITHFNEVASGISTTYTNLISEMDADVVLKRVLSPNSVKGIGDASGYLNVHMAPLKPSLKSPVYNAPWFPGGGTNATSTYGQVTGTGQYFDKSTSGGTQVTFILSFVRSSTSDTWSLINSFSYPT
jgi:hypothetical protein